MEKSDLSHHILSRYNDDLERVRTNVLQMGGFVEEQLKQAVTALVQGDSRLGEQVARGDAEGQRDGSRDRRRLQPHPRDAQPGGFRPAPDRRGHQDDHGPGAHRR